VYRHRLCLRCLTVARAWCFSTGWTVPACYRHRATDRQSSPGNLLPRVGCVSTGPRSSPSCFANSRSARLAPYSLELMSWKSSGEPLSSHHKDAASPSPRNSAVSPHAGTRRASGANDISKASGGSSTISWSASLRRPATVDLDTIACHHCSCRRSQVKNCARHFATRGEACCRDPAQHPFKLFGSIDYFSRKRGIHYGRCDRVNSHPMGCPFECTNLGHQLQPAPCSRNKQRGFQSRSDRIAKKC